MHSIDLVDDTQHASANSEAERESEAEAEGTQAGGEGPEAEESVTELEESMPLDDMPVEETQGESEGEELAAESAASDDESSSHEDHTQEVKELRSFAQMAYYWLEHVPVNDYTRPVLQEMQSLTMNSVLLISEIEARQFDGLAMKLWNLRAKFLELQDMYDRLQTKPPKFQRKASGIFGDDDHNDA